MGRRAFRRNDVIDQQSQSQTEPIPAAPRNVHLDNATSGATFTRTVQPSPRQDNHTSHQHCLVQLKIAGMPRARWGSQPTSGRSQSRSSRFTLQFRWRGAPPAAKSFGNSRIGSPRLTPSGRVDAVRGGSSFVAAHWGDQAPDAVGDGCSGNFGLRRRHVGPLTTGTATGHSPSTGIGR